MKSKYNMVRLGDFVQQVRGVSYGKDDISDLENEGYIPILRANNIQNFKLVDKDFVFVKSNIIKDEQIVKKGDILVATSSGSKEIVGKSAQAKVDLGYGFGAFCKLLRANGELTPDFLAYYLMTDYYRNTISNIVCGANINNMRNEHIDELLIPLPSIKGQNKIVDILSKSQELIDKRKEQIEACDELIKGLFYDMFGDPANNSKGWEYVNFGDVIDILTDYHANGSYEILRKHVQLLDKENYALMIRTTDLENKVFNKDVKYITKEAYEFLSKTKVYGGEIIINKIGSAGNVYLMPYLNRLVSLGMNQFMIRLNEKINTVFIYRLLTSKYGGLEISKRVQGAVTKTITKDAVRSIPIILPPIHLQNQFANKVQKIEQQKSLMQQSLTQLENNFNSLMQRAFKGELF